MRQYLVYRCKSKSKTDLLMNFFLYCSFFSNKLMIFKIEHIFSPTFCVHTRIWVNLTQIFRQFCEIEKYDRKKWSWYHKFEILEYLNQDLFDFDKTFRLKCIIEKMIFFFTELYYIVNAIFSSVRDFFT